MSDYAVLKGHEVVPCSSDEWLLQSADARRVGLDEVGDWHVSTVFLGLDHSFGSEPPLWFETMVFARESSSDLFCDRYSTWEDAVTGHQSVVEQLLAGAVPDALLDLRARRQQQGDARLREVVEP